MNQQATLPAVCGIFAPPLMVALWAVASVLRPGYDQLAQKGSELGTGQNSIVMNVNFLVTGILIVIFALGLFRGIRGGIWPRIGLGLLLPSGLTEAMTGFFPCDLGCPATLGSFSQNAHLGIGLTFFGSIAFSPLLIGLGMSEGFWKPYRSYSILSGISGVCLGAGFSVAILVSSPYVGLMERLFLAVPFLWIELMAIRLFRVR